MQVTDHVALLRRWVPSALVVAIVCAGLAFVVSKYLVQQKYTATTTMLVQPSRTLATTPDALQGVVLAQTWAAIAEQHPIVQMAYQTAIQKEVGLEPPATDASKIANQSPSATCQSDGVTSLFTCSVTANSPRFAAEAANAVAHAFVHQEMASPENTYWEAQVVNPAQVPTAPSSPHTTLNATVAFVLVFLLVLGFGLIDFRSMGRSLATPTPNRIAAGSVRESTASPERGKA